MPPATVATYQVTAEAVVDFTGGYNAEHQKGEIPNALDWLDTAYRLKDPGLAWLKVDFLLDPLGAEPRFLVIGRKLSFPE